VAEQVLRLEIETPRVFVPALQPSRYKAIHGGRGSGKSHFFAERLVERVAFEGISAVCIREYQKSLDQSVKRLLEFKIRALGLQSYFKIYENRIESITGGLIIFQGMQSHNAETIKSLEGFDVAWVEEAQSLSQHSLSLLRPTIRKPNSEIWFSWNPDKKSDPVDALFRGGTPPIGTILIEVNYYDNPWFPDVLREEMEYDKKRDHANYLHVWMGKYHSVSEALVFKNWKIQEFEAPEGVRLLFGGDWGFSKDPSVLVRSFIEDRQLFIDYEAYKIGCEIDYLPALFAGSDTKKPRRWQNPFGFPGVPGAAVWPIVADSARPETIKYMRMRGFDIRKAIKGARSVEEGVEFLRSYDIIVHPRCTNTIYELENYSHKIDKMTEEILPTLEDKDNHVIDALRYSAEGVRRATRHQQMSGPIVIGRN